jgi:hypothetical protein
MGFPAAISCLLLSVPVIPYAHYVIFAVQQLCNLRVCVFGFQLSDGRQPQGAALDSARQNLASTFVNAFVNAGYGQDKLVTVSTEGQSDSGELVKYFTTY